MDAVLYRTVEQRSGLPGFVKCEFEAYLRCGVLAHGFVRVRCDGCALERLVPFSRKGRGFCPSCGGRRMTAHAAQLVEARPLLGCGGPGPAASPCPRARGRPS